MGDQSEVHLIGIARLKLGDALVFTYRRHGIEAQGFLLRVRAGLFAFANRCPHWEVDLDMEDGDFFDERSQAIMCKNHGALFEPETGLCTHGPCRGAYLRCFAVRLSADQSEAWVNVEPTLEVHE